MAWEYNMCSCMRNYAASFETKDLEIQAFLKDLEYITFAYVSIAWPIQINSENVCCQILG